MRLGIILLISACLSLPALAQVRVKGYFRKDGTYVAPHYRSSPNNSRLDNYSTKGNYNPYTGERGTEPAWPTYNRPEYQIPQAPRYYQPAQDPTHSAQAYYDALLREQQRRIEASRQQAQNYLAAQRAALLQSLSEGRSPKSLSSEELFLLQATTPTYAPQYFAGYPCTQDCSGHEAGYEWAEDNDITDADDCGGNSQSFIEGCEAWAEENGD